MRRRPAVAAAIVTVAAGAVAACGSSATTTPVVPAVVTARAPTRAAPPPVPKPRPRPVPKPRPKPRPKPPPSPGTLPQTDRLPSANTRAFRAEMAALWEGVRHNAVRLALPSFFPEAAYLQVKAEGDPAVDWSERLVRDLGLDLSAAHALLGPQAGGARLLRVIVPAGYVHWVDPGACYNRVGYYEVPNSRVVYTRGGAVRSFGIASMISWRGVWYVVHLGSIVGPSGVVDDPSSGEGYSAPSSTC